MRTLRFLAAFCLLCLVALPAAAQVTPEALSRLEARSKAKPNDAGALRALGIALFKVKRYPEAQDVLLQARKLSPKDPVVALYIGMCAEERNDLPAARAAYTTYLATGRTRPAKDAVSERLAAVAQKELAANAKAAVAQEQRLASQRGPLTTIAVLPLSVTGNDTYAPLGRGLADLMISDFAKVPSITLLERDRVQAMLDEIALGRTTQVDRTTAARSGRLLQAGRVINGSLNASNAQNMLLSASIVAVETGQTAVGGSQNGTLDNIFSSEKAVVLQTLKQMGITPTAEQQREINDNRPTKNIQAFLAYSRGLASSDAGRLGEAATFFDNAHALDPSFGAAAAHAGEARAGQTGQTITTARIEATLRGTSEGQIVAAAERGAVNSGTNDALGATLQNTLADVNPSAADAIGRVATGVSSRDVTASATGNETGPATKTGTLTLVIKRP